MFLIGIGANLPGQDGEPPLATARWAAARLDALPGLRLRGLSRWYLTEPVPPSGQPPYVNAIAALAVAAGRRGTRSRPTARLAARHRGVAPAGCGVNATRRARSISISSRWATRGRWCAPRRTRYCRTRARICGLLSWCPCSMWRPDGCIRCCGDPRGICSGTCRSKEFPRFERRSVALALDPSAQSTIPTRSEPSAAACSDNRRSSRRAFLPSMRPVTVTQAVRNRDRGP